jgi:adenylyltransferase/sulfurtransferase
MPKLTQDQALRYSRQIFLQGFDLDKQECLLNSKVLQIGVGGLGCAAAQYLVASGVGAITLVDDDKIDKSNLQRQVLFAEADLGRSKCATAKDNLERLNSNTQIHCIEHRLADKELLALLQTHDILLDCSDNLSTRNQLNKASLQSNRPLVSGAAIRMEGQIASFIPSTQNPCYQCLSAFFPEQDLSCVEAGIMSPVVGIIGSMQALEAIKILTAFGQPLVNKLLMFDGASMQWNPFVIPKNPSCAACAVEI